MFPHIFYNDILTIFFLLKLFFLILFFLFFYWQCKNEVMSWFNFDSYYQNEIKGAEIVVANIIHSRCLHPNFPYHGTKENSFKFG